MIQQTAFASLLHLSGLLRSGTGCQQSLFLISNTQGTTNSSNFLLKYLLPQLHRFDGTSNYSVVMVDNCTIHHAYQVVALILIVTKPQQLLQYTFPEAQNSIIVNLYMPTNTFNIAFLVLNNVSLELFRSSSYTA